MRPLAQCLDNSHEFLVKVSKNTVQIYGPHEDKRNDKGLATSVHPEFHMLLPGLIHKQNGKGT